MAKKHQLHCCGSSTISISFVVMEKAGLKFEKTFIDQETNQMGVKYALNKEEFSPEKYMA